MLRIVKALSLLVIAGGIITAITIALKDWIGLAYTLHKLIMHFPLSLMM